MHRIDLPEIRERTYKKRDAWWTVLLVDPLASRLVRLVAPYRWITPNLLTLFATVLGLLAAGCFAGVDRGWLIAGALLFHASFVIDCMDGKIARLNGTGSMFGAWFDFMFDRLRVIICAVALFGGQYARSGNVAYVWTAFAVVGLDLLRYLNSTQMSKVKRAMRREVRLARGEDPVTLAVQAALAEQQRVVDSSPISDDELGEDSLDGSEHQSFYVRARDWLLERRIRPHLVSGIEFEMTVFIIGPLIGFIIVASIVAGALLTLFELILIYRLWLATREYTVEIAAIERELAGAEPARPGSFTAAATAPAQRTPAGSATRTGQAGSEAVSRVTTSRAPRGSTGS